MLAVRVSIIKKNRIDDLLLPIKAYGSFWLNDKDTNGNERHLIIIEAVDDKWLIKSDSEVNVLVNQKPVSETFLNNYEINDLKLKNDETILIYITLRNKLELLLCKK